jgi:predicted DCC family thiol-disulfide oxidoreductase YuxK
VNSAPAGSAWTGGQYSVFRMLFGAYLCVHFAQLLPWAAELFSDRGALPVAGDSPLLRFFPNVLALWDGPGVVAALVAGAAVLALLLAAGFHDRLAAVLLWYVWACLHGRLPLIGNPGLPYVGWMLLAHACLPRAPYLSWEARGRPDPGGGWRMTPGIFAVAWVLMAVGYSYSGATKLASPSWLDGSAIARVLENPLARPGFARDMLRALPPAALVAATWSALALELLFAPLALVRRLRPWLWAALLAMHLGLMLVIDFADLSLGMVLLHAFTFDPAWVAPQPAARGTPVPAGAPEWLFYDGHCGLCHRAVRFVLAEDASGGAFRFAPLGGETFAGLVPAARRAALPDSLVVGAADGALLVRARAVLHIGQRLGGWWRVLATVAGMVPAPVLDRLYDGVARVRHRVFAAPVAACPLVPASLAARFGS